MPHRFRPPCTSAKPPSPVQSGRRLHLTNQRRSVAWLTAPLRHCATPRHRRRLDVKCQADAAIMGTLWPIPAAPPGKALQ